MSMMNELLKSTSLESENGDATSIYDCELARDNITVREFVEAVENSVNNRGQTFNEWWATVSLSFDGNPIFPPLANYTVYGNRENGQKRYCRIELGSSPSSIEKILTKYDACIVTSCTWSGGWGSGWYHLKIKKGGTKTRLPCAKSSTA